ncbi:hypothetical protein [Nocardioides sp.]|uniref:hypothetical protein n=1 Tax=Nocardioides sp. TaxID=35761 RepID=UPI003562D2F9
MTTALNEALDLGLTSVLFAGLALGAVVALVPDTTAARRLAGFAAGFAVALLGYLVRAALLPDSASGRAVAMALVIMLCAGVVVLSVQRLPFWALLLGAGGFAAVYELTYAAAPTEVLDTSVSAATSLVLTVALGFIAALLVSSERRTRAHQPTAQQPTAKQPGNVRLEQMMEDAR